MSRGMNYLDPLNLRSVQDAMARNERKAEYAEWIKANVDEPYGKCQEWSHAMVAFYPELRLARGWYDDPEWGQRQHWWCVTPDGRVVDPTAAQFPSRGVFGEYREVTDESEVPTGICLNCGDDVYEGTAVCSDPCAYACASYYELSSEAFAISPGPPAALPSQDNEALPRYEKRGNWT